LLSLVAAAQAGDRAARETLVESFQPLIRSLCRGWSDYEDHYQEAVCQFLELVREYDQARSVYFGHYMKVKLAWRLRNYRRLLRGRSRPEVPLPAAEHLPAAAPELAEQVDLQTALQSLSARQRAVVVRSYWQDEGSEPIARDLGVSARAVRALRQRAERRLAELLADDRQGGGPDRGPARR
jgi:RNA polymerase sigma factor (sigma-70 family)